MRLSEEELVRWGLCIGESVGVPVFIGLSGPLGAGKSVLARAIGRGAGVGQGMPSPSYNLLFRYPGDDGVEVVHLDLYRIVEPAELFELGWEELGDAHEIVLVEWPERADGLLPTDHWRITLTPVVDDPHLRDIEVSRAGDPPDLPGFPMKLSAAT
ncbi:MAG: tRNA (adenosine(37)-N6)-threonylcarbamoyltransferase complex ATPase subunit type 1 TsaE [Gemmatimonadota bacterium]|nr:tRNA (adenosine(37)-N6)-threonylcarbamoyltransferase complex ATPase subunit type 1 TsaE [Gemmatimonadota bacterium]